MNEELDHSAGSLLSTKDNKVIIASEEVKTSKALSANRSVSHKSKTTKKKKHLKSKTKQDSSHHHDHKKKKKKLHEGEETKPRDHHVSNLNPSSPHRKKSTKKTSTKTTTSTSHEKKDTTSDKTINSVNVPFGEGSDPLTSTMVNNDIVVDLETLSVAVIGGTFNDGDNIAVASDIEAVPVDTAVPSSSGGGCSGDDDDDDGHDMTPNTLDSGTGSCDDETTCKPDPEEYIGFKIGCSVMVCDDNKDDESEDTDDEGDDEDIENSTSSRQGEQTAANIKTVVAASRNHHQDLVASRERAVARAGTIVESNARLVARAGPTSTNRYSPSGRSSDGDSSCSCRQIALSVLLVIIFFNVLRWIIILASSNST